MTDDSHVAQLLIAAPWLKDSHFTRTVVLICADDEDGTIGLVLNRPLELTLADGLPGTVSAERAETPIYGGGPVASTSLFALHDLPRLGEDSRPVLDGVHFMPGTHSLIELLSEGPVDGEVLRVFAGCAGWSPGQLAEELEEDAWIVCPAKAELVFAGEPETLWTRALRSLGPKTAFLATMPEDLRLN